jgi:hypothetical protein
MLLSAPSQSASSKTLRTIEKDRMIENPGVAAVVAVIAGAMGWTTRSRLLRAILWSGAAILVAAWGPLLGSSFFCVHPLRLSDLG